MEIPRKDRKKRRGEPVRNVRVTDDILDEANRIADLHGVSQAVILEQALKFVVSLKDDAAVSYMLNLSPPWRKSKDRAALVAALKRIGA